MTKYFGDFVSNVNKMIYTINDNDHILQLNYAYLISCMETYLSNAMWGTLEQYPANYADLGKGMNSSAKLSTIFFKGISRFIKEELKNLQYHNLPQVKMHYKNAFNINFQADLTNLFKAVSIRHDIVHRCGKSKKNNKSIAINFKDIDVLKADINTFIKDIDNQLCLSFSLMDISKTTTII